MLNLNLGSGPAGIDGWLNYDWGLLPWLSRVPIFRDLLVRVAFLPKSYIAAWPNIKLVDIRKKLPNIDGSVDFIYCSHVLEHFEKYETKKILAECFRVLKRGGVLRVVLPDLNILINNYHRHGKADVFCDNFFGWYKDQGENNHFRFLIRDHQWMYDSASFKTMLRSAGFTKINLQKFGQGLVPDLNQLDVENYCDHSFYIEATK